jgi:hypothetical protein
MTSARCDANPDDKRHTRGKEPGRTTEPLRAGATQKRGRPAPSVLPHGSAAARVVRVMAHRLGGLGGRRALQAQDLCAVAFPLWAAARAAGLLKEEDGRAQAVDDARGARLGSLGLVAFALIVWRASRLGHSAVVLAIATATWLAVSMTAWWLEHRHDKAS